jgi:hypothetical protein
MSNIPDFIKWFDDTYEISLEAEPMKLNQLVYDYKGFLIPFYKTNKEWIKNSKKSVFLKELQNYKYIYENHYKKWKKEFIHIRRKSGWN